MFEMIFTVPTLLGCGKGNEEESISSKSTIVRRPLGGRMIGTR